MLAAAPIKLGGIGYFPAINDPAIHRYDIDNEQWLSSITLENESAAPDAVHIDEDGIYAAFDKVVYRYDPAGASRQHLFNSSTDVIVIHSDGDVLFVNHSSGLYTRATSINKTTNTIVDTMDDYLDTLGGSSIAPSKNRMFGRSQGISPSDITYVSYDDLGNLIANADSKYHGGFQGGSKTWVFDDERYVIDNSGNFYTTDSLIHSGRLGSGVTDIAFHGGTIPIVLNGNTITAYSTGFLPTGSYELNSPGQEIFVNSKNVLVYREAPTSYFGYSVDTIALSNLNAPEPSDTVDPIGLQYEPDEVHIAADGTVLLYSFDHQSVFRWDPVSESYTQSIRLLGAPNYVAYSDQLNVLYTAYPDGLIRKIDLNSDALVEVPFAQLPVAPLGLVTAGTYLVAEDGSGAWTTLNTITSDGVFVESKQWHYPSSG